MPGSPGPGVWDHLECLDVTRYIFLTLFITCWVALASTCSLLSLLAVTTAPAVLLAAHNRHAKSPSKACLSGMSWYKANARPVQASDSTSLTLVGY